MEPSRNEILFEDITSINNIVARNFNIQDTTSGTRTDKWLFRFRGVLRNENSEQAYEEIANLLTRFHLKPLFRVENGQQVIYLIEDLPAQAPANKKINIILFIATLLSVWFTGGLLALESLDQGSTWDLIKAIFLDGWPFAVSLIAILGAHEMGHFFAGRYHKVNVTLPYFIPLPVISPFGTMGAFINMRGIPKNKKQLFDIGIAGPLSGLLIAIPVLFIGLSLSKVLPLPTVIGNGNAFQMEGNSLLYLLMKYITFGKLLPQPVDFGNVSPFLYWLRYFFTGQPMPLGGLDVNLHPVAWAGWAGILVTSLNLIPIGQLDGGHILSTMVGKNSRKIFSFLLVLMVILGFAWNGWWLWAFLLFFLNKIPSQVADEITPLDRKRKMLAAFMLIVFILVFIPVPLVILS
ncbi:MAG: hypothetical protein BGO78_04755 [Chloroflexi bacterium 44-23]|nr:MAG: hypothetical protein BGO78_04755 [Chloroflexi bacterium 44-23]